MSKIVLAAGGAGFLGCHICDRLLKEGNSVICLDNLTTGHKSNIEKLLSNRNFEFKQHNVWDPIYHEVDEILNLACPARLLATNEIQWQPSKHPFWEQ